MNKKPPYLPVSERQKRPWPVALRLVLGLILLILLGTGLLMLPAASNHQPLPFIDAFFTATSALTVTGLTVRTTSTDFTLMGHLTLLGLIQVGGVGYMFAVSLLLLFLRRGLTFRDRLTLTASLGLDKPGAIFLVLRRSFWGILIVEAVGALLLYFHWRANGIVAEERLLLFAVFHAVSAFCNAGFDLFAGLSAYPDGIPADNVSLFIMGTLIFIGGLGIPVLSEILNLKKVQQIHHHKGTKLTKKSVRAFFSFWLTGWHWPHFSLHTRLTLRVVVLLVLVGWVGLFLPEVRPDGVLHGLPTSNQLMRSLFQSLSARTAGFPGLSDFNTLQNESQLLIMVLMFIGCAPASMGGGITTGTFGVLLLNLRSYALGLPEVRWGYRAIAPDIVRRAGVVLTVSIFLVVVATWLILMTHRLPLNMVLFEVISAFATCGLSLGITGELNLFGRLILIVLMLWGRLGALTLVTALGANGESKTNIQYPAEKVLI
jgi:trk system potassium uptake protein